MSSFSSASMRGAPPAQTSMGARSTGESVLGGDLLITGDVMSAGDIRVDGKVRGNIECSTLTVSEHGEVEGGVVAKRVVIHGRVSGDIRGGQVMLHSTAIVYADIQHKGIGIEMGTRYDGTLRYIEEDASAPTAPAPTPAAPGV
ncbi:MAG: polymer-forming cytoskeletal protein [Neomegalonema sp.]|nr:polymer-forming cytoskeletal protein [Neomegalonema sp.]